MDGLDISAIDRIDQEIFNGSASDSDECEEMPLPDCIGIDSALQDDDLRRKDEQAKYPVTKTRTEKERELELKVMKPGSIRRQILEQSICNRSSANKPQASSSNAERSRLHRSHVMNITEKAGMSGIDKDKINQIIHEASKGSLFYKRQAQRQAEIHKSIEKMLNRVKAATPVQVEKARITCDTMFETLERQRVFNRVIVHFDLDMFFAAVEIRDNPELKGKPVAVGGESMVSTSNYIARKFGVRAAMPGFIAKKLCPDLILIKPNGFKYREASSEVFAILEQYDPELTSMSLDEAYLDLTDYIKGTLERDNIEYQEYYDGTLPVVWWTRAGRVVEEIREAIFEKTKLTCSGGIACNTLLAKIATDINKPNGQFMIQGYPKDVLDFISKTPVEKVSGIGKVSAQFLNALDIKTCGDIFEKRHFLPLVFYEINVKFYLRVALGDGSTSIKSDEQRKSKSVERTFSAIKDSLILLDKLDNICEELCTKYLKPYRIRGRTVTVKLKRNTFMTTTKSYSMLVPTNDKLVIYSAAKNLLLSEITNEPPEISYRLLGVKLSNLADDGVTTNQLTIDAMLKNQEMGKSTKSELSVHQVQEDTCSSDMARLDDSPATTDEPMEVYNSDTPNAELSKKAESSELAASTKSSCVSTRNSNKTIESFFAKRDKSSKHESVINQPDDGTDSEVFKCETVIGVELLDAQVRQGNTPDELSQQEQLQNRPHDDDFQCPYCFKPFGDFNLLEAHIDNCKMKIPIDVNRSFFSQRTQTQQKSPANGFFSQFMSNNSSRKSLQQSQAPSMRKVRQSTRVKRQPTRDRSTVASQSPISPVSNGNHTFSQDPCDSSGRKLSFYERFLESNSQKLRQSNAIDPFQCPYCLHGFICFSSLESHVVMCTKKPAGE